MWSSVFNCVALWGGDWSMDVLNHASNNLSMGPIWLVCEKILQTGPQSCEQPKC
jgi:hypothetical protein